MGIEDFHTEVPMIRQTADGSRGAVDHTLGLSNLVLFFSLPFKPTGSRNLSLNGHIALGVEGTIYQAYDPKRLKADFLLHTIVLRSLPPRSPGVACSRHALRAAFP
jgi:hypothetical protein